MNVIVLVIDNLRADFLGCYGNQWIDTPAISEFAGEAVVFDLCLAARPTCSATRREWWWGNYSTPLRLGDHSADSSISCDVPWWWIGTASCLSRHREAVERRFSSNIIANCDTPAATLKLARRWLKSPPREPWVLWLELESLLPPRQAPEPFARMYDPQADDDESEDVTDEADLDIDESAGDGRDVVDPDDAVIREYAACVSWIDSLVGDFLGTLTKLPFAAETCVILTSDHGTALSGDSAATNAACGSTVPSASTVLRNENLQLPLLVRFPGNLGSCGRTHAIVQPVDLFATLADLTALRWPANVDGGTLVPILRGESDTARGFAVSASAIGVEQAEWGIRTKHHSLVIRATIAGSEAHAALFIKPDDRHERNDVSALHSDQVRALAEQLGAFLRGVGHTTLPPSLSSILQ